MSNPTNPIDGAPTTGDPYRQGPAGQPDPGAAQEQPTTAMPAYGQSAPQDATARYPYGAPADASPNGDSDAQLPYGQPAAGAAQEQPTTAMPAYGAFAPQGSAPQYPYGAPDEQPTQAWPAGQSAPQYGQYAAPGPDQIPPQIPPQGPYEPYGYGQAPAPGGNDKWNGLVIAGFVCSFLIPIVGLILSIIGMVQLNKKGGKSKGMAIAGIVISVASMILNAVLVSTVLPRMIDEIQKTTTSQTPSQSPSSSAPSDDPTDDADDWNLDDDWGTLDEEENDLDDDANEAAEDTLERRLAEGATLEQALSDPSVQKQLQDLESQMHDDDMTMKIGAKGNTMIYTVTLTDTADGAAGDMMASMLESAFGGQLDEMVDDFNDYVSSHDAKIQLIVNDAAGKTLVDKTYTGTN